MSVINVCMHVVEQGSTVGGGSGKFGGIGEDMDGEEAESEVSVDTWSL